MRATLPPALVLLIVLGTSETAAQSAMRPGGPPVPAWSQDAVMSQRPLPTWRNRLATGLAGAALGAGAGFFASQVGYSDWAEGPETTVNRGLWAAVGSGAGFALGFSFPLSLQGTRPRAAGTDVGRTVISTEEMRRTGADNVYDVVRLLRPEWLNTRPPDELGEVQNESMAVYLDDFRQGGVAALRRIHTQGVAAIRFVPAHQAVARWGTGNAMGVIQVLQLPAPPS